MSNPYDEVGDPVVEDRAIARALTGEAAQTDGAAMDRATIDEYSRVLSYLPFDEIAPPVDLEDRVIAAALARRPATVRSISGRRAARWATLGAAVAAAAAVIAFMFITANDSGNHTPGGRVDLVGQNRQAVIPPILNSPGVRQTTLTAADHKVGEAALAKNGSGVLYDITLPEPGVNEHYWVWLVTKDRVVPIGVLPDALSDPNTPVNTVPFKVTGDTEAVTGISISLETGRGAPESPAAGGIVASGQF